MSQYKESDGFDSNDFRSDVLISNRSTSLLLFWAIWNNNNNKRTVIFVLTELSL